MRWLLVSLVLASAPSIACDKPAGDASRIAIAGGSITEIVYYLGEESRIVATDTTSNFPPEAQNFPSVGYVRTLSTEGLISLGPTLILGEDDMGPPAVLEQIEQTGIDIIMIPEAHTAQGIVDKVRCIGRILDVADRADQVIEERLDETLASLDAIAANANDGRPRAAVILGLRDGVPLGAGTETSGDGLLTMAGADNVLDAFSGWKPLSLEALIEANPDFIIVPNRGVDSAGGADALLSHPALRLTNAAKEEQLIAMDGMTILGFGPRTLGAAVELASILAEGETAQAVTTTR